MSLNMDLIAVIALGAVGVIAVLYFVFRKKPSDYINDFEDLPEDGVNGKSAARVKNNVRSGRGCMHDFQITGIPPDKIGTHVSLTCSKCGQKKIVTISESYDLLRQRDDVRDAKERARGGR